MSRAIPTVRRVAAPRTTRILAGILTLGVLAEAAFAGGFLGGSHVLTSWHENLGDILVLPPLASLIVGLALRRRQPENGSMLASRAVLLILVIVVVATGHAVATGHESGGLLAVHIPAAVAVVGLAVRQAMTSARALEPKPATLG